MEIGVDCKPEMQPMCLEVAFP